MYGKDFFASKATWGAIVMLVAPALRAFGVEFDQQAVADAITTVAGLVLFLIGQFSRKAEITSVAGVKVKS